MVIEISIAVIAVAIVVLVIYLVKVLKTFNTTLQSVNETVAHIEGELDQISKQSVSLLEETRALTTDLNQKSQKLDNLFSSAKSFGDSIDQVSASLVAQAEQHRAQLGNLLAISRFGLEVWQQWKSISKRDKQKGGR